MFFDRINPCSPDSAMYLLAHVNKTQYPQIFCYLTGNVF